MNQATVMADTISKMSSRDLHMLAEKSAKLEYARLHLAEPAQIAAKKEMDNYVTDVLSRLEALSANSSEAVLEG